MDGFTPLPPGGAFRASPAPPRRAVPGLLSGLPDLDAPEVATPPGMPPAEVEALIEAVRDAAFAEGRDEGERAGRAAAEAASALRLEAAIGAAMAGMAEAARQARAEAAAAAEALARLLLATVDAALPVAAARAAPGLLDRLIRELGPLLEAPEGATLLVPPGFEAEARARVAAHGIPVRPDPALPPGDARVAWRGGSLVLDLAARRAAIRAVLAALDLAPAEAGPDASRPDNPGPAAIPADAADAHTDADAGADFGADARPLEDPPA